jgi:NAD(P) transhydrogenase subunit alpha
MDTGFILWTVMMFVLAAFVGHHVIHGVPTLLHTPLMSATAISAISVVGAIVVAGSQYELVRTILGVTAVAAAMCNVVGGFLITERMLKMFKGGGSGLKGGGH